MEPQGAIEARISRMEQEAKDLHKTVENFTNTGTAATSSGGSVIIRLDAGKFSAWAAAGICIVVLAFFSGAALTAGLWFSREFAKQDAEFINLRNQDQVHDAYINKLRAEQKQEKKP